MTKTRNIQQVCGVVTSITLLICLLIIGLLVKLGVFNTPLGFSISVILFFTFTVAEIIRKRVLTRRAIAFFESEEDDDNGYQLVKKKQLHAEEYRNKKTGKTIPFVILCIVACITAIVVFIFKLITVFDLICIIILMWPAFQIARAIRYFVIYTLAEKEFRNE